MICHTNSVLYESKISTRLKNFNDEDHQCCTFCGESLSVCWFQELQTADQLSVVAALGWALHGGREIP